jgi:outer membrane protein
MTLRSLRLIALACLVGFGAIAIELYSNPAAAQTAAPQPAAQLPLVVGIVDGDAVLNKSTAGKSLRQQFDQKVKALQADVAKQEDALRTQLQNLQSQRASLQPQDFDAKQLAIRQQADKLRTDAVNKRKAINQSAETARDTLVQSAQKALQDVAQQKGMTLVIDKSATHLSAPGWDMTNEVLQRLNKALPTIKM